MISLLDAIVRREPFYFQPLSENAINLWNNVNSLGFERYFGLLSAQLVTAFPCQNRSSWSTPKRDGAASLSNCGCSLMISGSSETTER